MNDHRPASAILGTSRRVFELRLHEFNIDKSRLRG